MAKPLAKHLAKPPTPDAGLRPNFRGTSKTRTTQSSIVACPPAALNAAKCWPLIRGSSAARAAVAPIAASTSRARPPVARCGPAAATGEQIPSARRSGKLAYGLPPNQPTSRRVTYQCSGNLYKRQSVVPFRTQTTVRLVCTCFPVPCRRWPIKAKARPSRPVSQHGWFPSHPAESCVSMPSVLGTFLPLSPALPLLSCPSQIAIQTFQSASRSRFPAFARKGLLAVVAVSCPTAPSIARANRAPRSYID